MRPGVTIVTIPGTWYVTSELTGPADRGGQPAGIWTGLAGAELDLHPGEPVNSSVLDYLVERFGGFDVIFASDRGRSAQHAQAVIEARRARQSGDMAAAGIHEKRVSDISAALMASSKAALTRMQDSGGPPVDDCVGPRNRAAALSLGYQWIIASFRHETDDETGDPLLHIHNVVPALTDRHWHALRDLGNDHAAEPA